MIQAEPPTLTQPILDRGHVRGSDDAPVTLVHYSDFECPYCGDIYPIVRRLQNRVGKRLQLVFRHFPLTQQHPHAQQAAEAAEAAGTQGRFWEMYDLLYENQDALSQEDLVRHAEQLDLDVDAFVAELNAGVYEERVQEDFLTGVRSGVNGTPTFFINGTRYDGPLEFDAMLAEIAEVGDFLDLQQSLESEDQVFRETFDRSRRGAPASGEAVRDRFSADEIFQRVTATADEDVERSTRLLFFSGLATGLSVGATFLARAALTAAYPQNPMGIGTLLYPVGFIIIVLGSYQLYTENTFTPVTLVLTRLASLPQLFRLWTIVLAANVVGAGVIAFLFTNTAVLDPATAETASTIGEHAMDVSWSALFYKGAFAGGLVATMVWLVHAARDTLSRFLIVYIIMILIPVADLFHCIVGACEILFLVFNGRVEFVVAFTDFFVPVVLGNTVGGIVFVALVNYSMTETRRFPEHNQRHRELTWPEWVFGIRCWSWLQTKMEESPIIDEKKRQDEC